MRWLWVAVVVACIFTLWARFPADAFSCTKVAGYVQSYGLRWVADRAADMGYTRAQMYQFRRHCRRQGVRF